MARVKCPLCRSTNIQIMSDNKKQFSLGKAAIGGALFGGLGALCGGLMGGKGKYEMFCMNCGHRFKRK